MLKYILPLTLLFFISCSKKKMELDVVQDACEKFEIKNPSYTRVSDPCNGGTTASFTIQFTFDGDEECLYLVENSPVFYTSTNNEISGVTFQSQIPKSNLTINGDIATYSFDIEFANTTDANNFNHMVLDFHTENEIENESNELQIRVNTSCSTVDPSTYDVNNNSVTVPSSQNFFTIRLWDNAAEDGDIVSVYLNGNWLIENHSLLKAGTDFTFSTSMLNSGSNDLVVFALNEGTSGPNTVSISVNGNEINNFKPGLLTGEAVRINF